MIEIPISIPLGSHTNRIYVRELPKETFVLLLVWLKVDYNHYLDVLNLTSFRLNLLYFLLNHKAVVWGSIHSNKQLCNLGATQDISSSLFLSIS